MLCQLVKVELLEKTNAPCVKPLGHSITEGAGDTEHHLQGRLVYVQTLSPLLTATKKDSIISITIAEFPYFLSSCKAVPPPVPVLRIRIRRTISFCASLNRIH
jgi:hypothetical protein